MSGIQLTTVAFDVALIVLVAISLYGLWTVARSDRPRGPREQELDEWRRDLP